MVLVHYRSSSVFSLGKWSPQLPAGFLVSRCTQDPDPQPLCFVYGAITRSGQPFQCCSTTNGCLLSVLQPQADKSTWFGLLRFRSPLLTEYSLFLRVLGCFSSPGSPLMRYVFTHGSGGIPHQGFPHSDIDGSQAWHASPSLFAVPHVLRRHLTPRHPPCALSSLTFKNHRSIYYSLLLSYQQ
jgi:hypothetical protein